jgi:hypothetical protein
MILFIIIIPCIAVVQTNDEGNLICIVHNREAEHNVIIATSTIIFCVD